MARPKPHDARTGRAAGAEDGPERRCIVSRESGPAAGLIRFVRAPDGAVVPDLRQRLPGRGAWVTAERAMVAEAVRRNAFSRAFKAPSAAPADLADQVERLMAARALETLSLAKKAGAVITGFAKVDAAVRAGEAVGLIHACDAGQDGVRRLEALARGLDLNLASVKAFRGEELDLALGRSNVIHAALTAGDITRLAIERARALERYRTAAPGGAAVGQVHAGTTGVQGETVPAEREA